MEVARVWLDLFQKQLPGVRSGWQWDEGVLGVFEAGTRRGPGAKTGRQGLGQKIQCRGWSAGRWVGDNRERHRTHWCGTHDSGRIQADRRTPVEQGHTRAPGTPNFADCYLGQLEYRADRKRVNACTHMSPEREGSGDIGYCG
jgi:hypothetical protein